MISRIAVVTSDVFVRRLTPALSSLVRGEREFRIIEITRPLGELVELLRTLRPAAVITEWLPEVTETMLELGFPTVIADTDEVFPGVASLDVHDRRIGEVAARFYREAGYRHFACVHLGLPYGQQRLAGFRGELARHGLDCADFLYAESPGAAYMESWQEPPPDLRAWLRGLPRPVAVFAVHDPLGNLVGHAAALEGLRIPDEVAVLGANNDELVCGLSFPPLSSVSIPWDRLGALAGQWAQYLIEGRPAPAEPVLIHPGPVVARQSTALTAVEDAQLRRALHYLRENAGNAGISVATLCADLRISRRSLERKFAAVLESTPWEVLCRMRTEAAQRLLAETDLPMAVVAERCGFGDPERFSIVFSRQTGQPPTHFRKATRGV